MKAIDFFKITDKEKAIVFTGHLISYASNFFGVVIGNCRLLCMLSETSVEKLDLKIVSYSILKQKKTCDV